jgi:hypothetical protein
MFLFDAEARVSSSITKEKAVLSYLLGSGMRKWTSTKQISGFCFMLIVAQTLC